MDLYNNPSIVIVNNTGTIPVSLLNQITKSSDIKEDGTDKLSRLWKIDNKYYTADIDVHGITEHYHRGDEFNENIKALIIHIDPSTECLTDLDKWKAIEHECELEIKLLVTDNAVDETKIALSKITDWCLKRGYEFIVLNPEEEIDQEDEIIKEKFGIDRIIEVLQTNVWPNLEMKELKHINETELQTDVGCGEQSNSGILNDLTNDTIDDFTELFGQLHMMKQSIQAMPLTERKLYAEQMVTAFWRAIGADEEELEDL